MDFEYTITDVICVEKYEFNKMLKLVNEKKYNYEEAFNEMVMGWDECDYNNADYIKDDVIREAKRRNAQKKAAKERN